MSAPRFGAVILSRRPRTVAPGGLARALVSGAAGAFALTAVHQLAADRVPRAPRMDIVGMRALGALLTAAHVRRS